VVGLLAQAFGALGYVFVHELSAFYAVAALFGFIYAGTMPLYSVLVRENFPLKMLGTVIGGLSMAGSLGMATGPIAGGLLTAHFGWRWIFLVNLPVSVAAVILTRTAVTESRDPAPRRVDLPGMATFTIATASLTYALIRGAWGSGLTIGLMALAACALAAFIGVERRSPDPMLDLSLLRYPSFTAILVAGALLSAAAWAAMTYQSLWLQSVLGLTAIKAGLVLLPCALAAFVVSAGIGRFLHTASPRLLVGTGLLVVAAGAASQAVIRAGSSWWVEIPGLVAVGIGAGLSMASLSATAMAAVPRSRAGISTPRSVPRPRV